MKKLIFFSLALMAKLSMSAQAAAPAKVPAPTVSSVPAAKPQIDHARIMHHDRDSSKMPRMSAADRAIQYSQQLKKSLSLTEDQYTQVLAVNTECITRNDTLKAGTSDKRKGSADIKTYRVASFQKIFTPDQMTAYQKMNQAGGQMTEHHKEHDGDKN